LDRYAVELENVSTYYYGEKRPAIRNVSLRIPAGALVLITGPNGAGKTTLLETIIGILKARRGRITVFDHEVPREAAKVKNGLLRPTRFHEASGRAVHGQGGRGHGAILHEALRPTNESGLE